MKRITINGAVIELDGDYRITVGPTGAVVVRPVNDITVANCEPVPATVALTPSIDKAPTPARSLLFGGYPVIEWGSSDEAVRKEYQQHLHLVWDALKVPGWSSFHTLCHTIGFDNRDRKANARLIEITAQILQRLAQRNYITRRPRGTGLKRTTYDYATQTYADSHPDTKVVP
jgi:hypothetical protein